MGRAPQGWYPRRGEVYLVELDKPRPAVVLSVDSLNRHSLDVCLVPFTTVQHAEFSMRVPVKRGDGGLDSNCWAKCDQVTTLEKDYLRYPALGMLSDPAFATIQERVKIALGFV
jgi:mRNA-degrading endonuclease toxin of MazEF toxin-antitoxin module